MLKYTESWPAAKVFFCRRRIKKGERERAGPSDSDPGRNGWISDCNPILMDHARLGERQTVCRCRLERRRWNRSRVIDAQSIGISVGGEIPRIIRAKRNKTKKKKVNDRWKEMLSSAVWSSRDGPYVTKRTGHSPFVFPFLDDCVNGSVVGASFSSGPFRRVCRQPVKKCCPLAIYLNRVERSII